MNSQACYVLLSTIGAIFRCSVVFLLGAPHHQGAVGCGGGYLRRSFNPRKPRAGVVNWEANCFSPVPVV